MKDSVESLRPQGHPPWLLLIHQLPPRPHYLRVKVRRRLVRLGARPLKNTVYALPWSEEAIEDFQWLRREIEAEGGEAVICEASLLEGLSDAALDGRFPTGRNEMPQLAVSRVRPDLSNGRVWVTRKDVHVDRIASAWLIRRFIDPKARFKFVPPQGYAPRKAELRFDMFEAEFTHEGDRCSFETLVHRFGLKDPALRVLGEMVHDIDCKDGKFRRAETTGLQRLIQGIVATNTKDAMRLRQGAVILDSFYDAFTSRRK
jgi:hypothetical protein